MYTYQMIGLADENGKTYECKYGTYSKESGFIFNETVKTVTEKSGWRKLVNILFHDDLWKLKQDIKKMTLEDVEKALGYKVQIVDPEPKKKIVSDKRKKEVDDTIDMFQRLFGIRFTDEDREQYY